MRCGFNTCNGGIIISQVISNARELLDVEEDEEEEGEPKPSIFRINGTVVPDSPINDLPWTVSRYVKSLQMSKYTWIMDLSL